MERKEFLKRLGLSSMVIPLLSARQQAEIPGPVNAAGDCVTTPPETAGPFPTKKPSSLVMTDITADRTGIDLAVKITIQNKNNNCLPLEGVTVDIWHCDKDGYYSEYGGSGMQSINLTTYHFLRGRQVTNSEGIVGFSSIFPGWYPSRAPHIHVHIYDSTGKSLLVTQIAFPQDICNTVYTTATDLYTHGTQDTSNDQDNVFADSVASEMAVITGSNEGGYILRQTIVVSA